jgi:hypothetical protein
MKLEGDKVVSKMGDVLAEKINGENPEVLTFIEENEGTKKKVRARNKDGHFIADDPSTPENEAWVVKTVKKVVKKKK